MILEAIVYGVVLVSIAMGLTIIAEQVILLAEELKKARRRREGV